MDDAFALVLGAGVTDLRACLERLSVPPHRTWCAVASREEAAAARGLARVVTYDPWPGRRLALERLHAEAADDVGDAPVVIVAAGTVLRRGALSRALEELRRGAGIVVASVARHRAIKSRSWVPLGRLGSRLLQGAVVRPGSGMVIRGNVLDALAARGWLAGRDLRVGELREIAGAISVLPGAIEDTARAVQAKDGRRMTVTVLIPAFNEQGWIGETLRSVRAQTRQPDEVIVVDDASSDRTAEVARHYGARVLRSPGRRSKAGAQNFGLNEVRTDAVVMLDADTLLHPEAVEHLLADLEAGNDATTGAVLPQADRGFWSRGRLIEYALAIRLYKRIQRFLGSLVVISGCVAAFRTSALRDLGGFEERTITEDLDVTWRLHFLGYRVGYATKAIGYPAEPPTWKLFKAQMRRWAGGFFQGVAVHRKHLPRRRALAFMVAAAVWDIVSPLIIVGLLGALALSGGLEVRWDILLIWQAIILGIPFVTASSVVGPGRALKAMPAYAVVLYLGQYFYLEAFVREIVLRQRKMQWVKGH